MAIVPNNKNKSIMTEIFNYNGAAITFKSGDNIMVNATEVLKAFPNKRMSDFNSAKSTKNYISALSTETGIPTSALYQAVKGGNDKNNQGTWLQEDLALYFAQWISPEFHIWCNARIKELLKIGVTAINPDDLLDPDLMIKYLTMLKESRENEAKAVEANKAAHRQIEKQAPKVEFANRILSSKTNIEIGQFAKVIGIGRNKLFEYMREDKILMSRGSYRNVPYQQHIDNGHFEVTETAWSNRNGESGISFKTVVTPKGQMFLEKKIS